MVRAWVKLIWNSLGVAAVAAAAQLAIAQALGIIRWDAEFRGDNPDGWSALLTWIAFIYAVAVLGGAAVGRRAVRRPTKPDTLPARISAALAAGIGASIAVGLAWLPAKAAKPPVSVHPELLVAMTAGVAIAAGVVIALLALSVAPIAVSVRAAVAWIWLVGIGSALAGYFSYQPYDPPRLAMLDAPSLIRQEWYSGPYVMVAIAVLLGVGVAALARWVEAGRFGIAISGFGGPVVVAAAYLIAGFGDGAQQTDPYRAALIAVGAGLIGSIAVAIPAPRRRAGAQSSATEATRSPGERPTARGDLPRRESSPAYAEANPAGRIEQPLLDEAYPVGGYPQEPATVPGLSGATEWPANPEPTTPEPAAPLGQPVGQPMGQPPAPPLGQPPARPTVIGQPSQRPAAAAAMGQPPARSYEEDYSDWLRDLGHIPGQRGGADREDQRN